MESTDIVRLTTRLMMRLELDLLVVNGRTSLLFAVVHGDGIGNFARLRGQRAYRGH